jgi:hypothetical protein
LGIHNLFLSADRMGQPVSSQIIQKNRPNRTRLATG